MRPALGSAGTAIDPCTKISLQCLFSRLVHFGCVEKWETNGNADLRASNRDRPTCCMARCVTFGNTASCRWRRCAILLPCARFASATALRIHANRLTAASFLHRPPTEAVNRLLWDRDSEPAACRVTARRDRAPG